jgi:outer membrane protein
MLNRTLALILTLTSLCLSAPARAEHPAMLSQEDCVRMALEKNHSLMAQSERLDAARAVVGQAGSYFLPKLTLSETYMRSDNPVMAFGSKLNQGGFTAADFDPAKLNNPDAVDNFNFRAELVQPVFNGGREMVGYKRAKLGLRAAEKELQRTRDETVFQVTKAYYGVLLAAEYVKVADKAYDTTTRHLASAQQFFDQGMIVESEVLLAKVRLAEVKQMRIKAVNSLDTAKAALNMFMGREQDSPVEPSGVLAGCEGPGKLGQYLDEAKGMRPDLAGMEINVRNMEAGVDMARTGYLPDLNLIGRYELDDKDPFRGRGKSYTVMGVLSWNVFDGFLTTKKTSEARANYNAAGHMYEQMKQGVLLEVRQAYNSAVEAGQRVDVARTAVDEGEEALRIIERRFDNGMARMLDVLDAETALTRARTNLAQALYDQNVSMASLRLATGAMSYNSTDGQAAVTASGD